MASILEGIRVVDCTVQFAGPGAAGMLADLGADVIHVEERGVGDSMRGLKTILGTSLLLPGDRQIIFEECNRNKKSIAVDLRKPKGKEIILDLVRKSDVFITNMKTSAVKRFGFDYKTLSQLNPRLVYASATGFGPRGPLSSFPALDPTALARSGLMWLMSEPDTNRPTSLTGLGDKAAQMALSYGVIAALLARERLGVAQEVTVSQLGALIPFASFALHLCAFGREVPKYDRKKNVSNPLYNYYRCKDGQWIALGYAFERNWPGFCQAVGMSQWIEDLRFKDAQKRAENCELLISLLDQLFATKTLEEWEGILGKMDAPLFSRINNISDVMTDPQVLANEYIVGFDHPVLGATKWAAFPVQFGKTPATIRSPAPEVGQHTEEVLLDVCGYSWDQIGELRDQEVI